MAYFKDEEIEKVVNRNYFADIKGLLDRNIAKMAKAKTKSVMDHEYYIRNKKDLVFKKPQM